MNRDAMRQRLQGLVDALKAAEPLTTQPHPSNLDACAEVLTDVSSRLQQSLCELAPFRGDGEILGVVSELRMRIRRLGRLLDQAASLHQKRQRAVGALTGGYTRTGHPPDLEGSARLWLEV